MSVFSIVTRVAGFTAAAWAVPIVGCSSSIHAQTVAAPHHVLQNSVKVESGQGQFVPVEASLSKTATMDVTFGDVRLTSAENPSSCCATQPSLTVRLNGFYRTPSDTDGPLGDGEAQWSYCVRSNATIHVPVGEEFTGIRGGVTLSLNAGPASYAEVRDVTVRP